MNPTAQRLNADAVLQAVRQGYIPDSWLVYRGRVSYQVQQILGGLVILTLGWLASMYLLLHPDIAFVPSVGAGDIMLAPDAFAFARVGDVAVVLLVSLVALIVAIGALWRVPTIRRQVLVLMPDGFVISTGRSASSYTYGAMQSLKRRRWGRTVTLAITPQGVRRRQRARKVRLDGRFGPARLLAGQMLAAHADWMRAHAMQSVERRRYTTQVLLPTVPVPEVASYAP